jgi:hypothetical protein
MMRWTAANTFKCNDNGSQNSKGKMKDWTTTLEREVEKKTRDPKTSQDKSFRQKLASLGDLRQMWLMK